MKLSSRGAEHENHSTFHLKRIFLGVEGVGKGDIGNVRIFGISLIIIGGFGVILKNGLTQHFVKT